MQIFRRIPGGGDQNIGLRISLLGLQSGHHFAGGRLEDIDFDPGFLFKAAGEIFCQRSWPGSVDGQRVGAGHHSGR
ncbi:hypothetical protein D3C86_2014700 [compost metagenome]